MINDPFIDLVKAVLAAVSDGCHTEPEIEDALRKVEPDSFKISHTKFRHAVLCGIHAACASGELEQYDAQGMQTTYRLTNQ